MPELPDVAIFKQYLDATALHQRIEAVSIKRHKILCDLSPQTLGRKLKGRNLQTCRRHGKWLFAQLDDSSGALVFHFGMTGFLQYCKNSNTTPTDARFLVRFATSYQLAFVCPRLFGTVDFTDDIDAYIQERNLGPDALQLEREQFMTRLKDKRGMIKTALMDQSLLSGLGNIYSDEILFQARIHPRTRIDHITDAALRTLHATLQKVLTKAINFHAAPERAPHFWLLPNRHKSAHCPRCGANLRRVKIQQRSAYICPRRQSQE